MNQFDLVLPFSLPPPELARDLSRQMTMPALSTLLARGSASELAFDPYSRLLPHQQWLIDSTSTAPASAGLARSAMQEMDLPGQQDEHWMVLHPANFHIARDHLVLTDLRALGLGEAESRELFEAALPLFEESGKPLVFGNPHTWFTRADDWSGLDTAAPDAAVGHNVDIWMPKGSGERDWRRLHNEVQMLWHTSPVNEQREMRGLRPANALWLWNAGPGPDRARGAEPASGNPLSAFLPGFTSTGTSAGFEGVAVDDRLAGPALAGNWGDWLQQMQAAEQDWFAPLQEALAQGKLQRLRIALSGGSRLLLLETGRMAQKKFWVKPSLQRLFAGGGSAP